MNNRYNGFDFIRKYINKNGDKYKFKGETIKDFQKWKEAVIPRLKKGLGFENFPKNKLSFRKIEKNEYKDYILEKVKISTMPSLEMPFYVMTPKKGNGKNIIALHGHGCNGKEGLISSEKNEEMVYSYALDLMKMGYTVYIPDLLGSGERRLGVYVEKEDSVKKLGVVGFSGGGFSGLWLGILDKRVKYVASSCYFHSFKDTLLFTNKCGCNFIPKLWNRVDMGDMAALVAPRPLYIEVGTEDSLNGDRGLIGVREQVDRAKKVYKMFDEDVEYKECEGHHQWFGSCYDWINKL